MLTNRVCRRTFPALRPRGNGWQEERGRTRAAARASRDPSAASPAAAGNGERICMRAMCRCRPPPRRRSAGGLAPLLIAKPAIRGGRIDSDRVENNADARRPFRSIEC